MLVNSSNSSVLVKSSASFGHLLHLCYLTTRKVKSKLLFNHRRGFSRSNVVFGRHLLEVSSSCWNDTFPCGHVNSIPWTVSFMLRFSYSVDKKDRNRISIKGQLHLTSIFQGCCFACACSLWESLVWPLGPREFFLSQTNVDRQNSPTTAFSALFCRWILKIATIKIFSSGLALALGDQLAKSVMMGSTHKSIKKLLDGIFILGNTTGNNWVRLRIKS
ncbi:hypothetical protein IV203_009898 [Nitzschia inconspicua]|uniref:Uncharacterized protein n=1 Tax=Nitzschia inconspicua TaxID=303405 RepID=A0A9K3KWN8_9STRA|nr:hypothetical protein IV203_009898 [Nitzschia inconspicua]